MMAFTNEMNQYRRWAVIAFAFLPFVLLLLGFCSYRNRSEKCIAFLVIFGGFITVLIIVSIAVHYVLSVAQDDLCNELDKENGLMQMLRDKTGFGFDDIGDLASEGIREIINSSCIELHEMCTEDPEVSCNDPTINRGNCSTDELIFSRATNMTITITTNFVNPVDYTIEECAETCPSQDMRDTSQLVLDFSEVFPQLVEVVNRIATLLSDITSGRTLNLFANNICLFLGSALTLMYTGFTMTGASLLGGDILLLFLSW
eukprot:TRINITY_DN1322_c0_g1_i2.p1 TRINITY_DN1322_c0_g1~~TRINITY_DN1322_c0_g1_i2.p1  ORF type:complete len:259 (-),score=40.64 TRINITY_DN1322_c0_g1_i2:49-825(-)